MQRLGMFRKGMIFTQHVYNHLDPPRHSKFDQKKNMVGLEGNFKDKAGYPIQIGAEGPPGSLFFRRCFCYNFLGEMRRQVGIHLEMGKTKKAPTSFFFLPPFWNV